MNGNQKKMIGDREEWLCDLLSLATGNMHLLRDGDQRFIIGTRGRYQKFLSHTSFSEKQLHWLMDIESRLADGGARHDEDRPEDEHGGVVPVDEYMRGRR